MSAEAGDRFESQRKVLQGLGMTPVEGVTRAVLYRGDMEFVFDSGYEVYYNPLTKTYVILGEPRATNFALQAQQLMAMMQQQQALREAQAQAPAGAGEPAPGQGGFSEVDVSTVMEQGGVDREKALALLKQHGDVVKAVLECQGGGAGAEGAEGGEAQA